MQRVFSAYVDGCQRCLTVQLATVSPAIVHGTSYWTCVLLFFFLSTRYKVFLFYKYSCVCMSRCITGWCIWFQNEQLNNLYTSPHIIRQSKTKFSVLSLVMCSCRLRTDCTPCRKPRCCLTQAGGGADKSLARLLPDIVGRNR